MKRKRSQLMLLLVLMLSLHFSSEAQSLFSHAGPWRLERSVGELKVSAGRQVDGDAIPVGLIFNKRGLDDVQSIAARTGMSSTYEFWEEQRSFWLNGGGFLREVRYRMLLKGLQDGLVLER